MKEENLNNTAAWVLLAPWRRAAATVISRMWKINIKKFVPEGIEGRVAFKGFLKKWFINIPADYVQVWVIAEQKIFGLCRKQRLSKSPTPVCSESHAHDIEITKEAPNYSR